MPSRHSPRDRQGAGFCQLLVSTGQANLDPRSSMFERTAGWVAPGMGGPSQRAGTTGYLLPSGRLGSQRIPTWFLCPLCAEGPAGMVWGY